MTMNILMMMALVIIVSMQIKKKGKISKIWTFQKIKVKIMNKAKKKIKKMIKVKKMKEKELLL